MDERIKFTQDDIGFIHRMSKKFIEEKHRNEVIFFDDFWEIYETELKKWVGKPPRKWRLKLRKKRLPRVIGMSDGTPSIKLITPAILEIVTASYTHIARMREKLTLEKIQKTIAKCCKTILSEDDKEQTINFFAPRIFEDLSKVGGDIENEEKVKKEYVIYSHLQPRGKEISKDEYFFHKSEIEKAIGEYLIFINEISGEVYLDGDEKKILPSQKKALKALIIGAGNIVSYKDLYEAVTGQELNVKRLHENDRNLVHKVIYDFRRNTTKKIKHAVEVERGQGYKFSTKKSKYCLIEFIL